MSINEPMVLLRDVREFSVGSAEFIALEVAKGASVKELHECHEDLVPSPIVVNRWRKNVPAFDMLMREAEECKAQSLADEVIGISDDVTLLAAQAGNAIKSRQWLSGQLSDQYRQGKTGVGSGVVINQNLRLTDTQLMQIASGGLNGQRLVEQADPLVLEDVVRDTVGEEEGISEDVSKWGFLD